MNGHQKKQYLSIIYLLSSQDQSCKYNKGTIYFVFLGEISNEKVLAEGRILDFLMVNL